MKLPQLSTIEYGLVGHPLGHSRSREIFAGWHRSYENFDLPELTPEALYRLVLLNPRLRGFNVTAPYKEAILPYLDSLDPTAQAVGAVNTVKIKRSDDGRVLALDGFNTDYIGFEKTLEGMIGENFRAASAVILGTGGAAKAVAAVFRAHGIGYKFASRSRRDSDTVDYAAASRIIAGGNVVIVNATPLGTYPDVASCPPVDYDAVGDDCKCIDLVYNPPMTEFMKRCASRGAAVKNGLEMLLCQAEASLNIWNNK